MVSIVKTIKDLYKALGKKVIFVLLMIALATVALSMPTTYAYFIKNFNSCGASNSSFDVHQDQCTDTGKLN